MEITINIIILLTKVKGYVAYYSYTISSCTILQQQYYNNSSSPVVGPLRYFYYITRENLIEIIFGIRNYIFLPIFVIRNYIFVIRNYIFLPIFGIIIIIKYIIIIKKL